MLKQKKTRESFRFWCFRRFYFSAIEKNVNDQATGWEYDSRYEPHKFIGDPIYSLETPIFSLESPRFSLEVLCIFIMTPLMRVSNENSGVSKWKYGGLQRDDHGRVSNERWSLIVLQTLLLQGSWF